MSVQWRTAKRFRGGRKRAVPQPFPFVKRPKKLPKLIYPARRHITRGKYADAEKWLKENPNKRSFAGNAFSNNTEALEYVKWLKKQGVSRALITGILDEPSRVAAEGGPYADTMIVWVPKRRLVKFLEAMTQPGVPDEFDKVGSTPVHNIYRLWWD